MTVPAPARPASPGWASRGACLGSDPELFFPIAAAGPARQQIAQARAICARCPVCKDCLSYALETGQAAGVWGGTSEEERRKMRVSRNSPRGTAASPGTSLTRGSRPLGSRRG